ncbi:hypothetical protein WJX81_002578 [Elliptochloris bilobata]|uniref:Protein kinase domain-containing protein n=1 Tax=Elliptochloris bilobata TaxID=381761 RepID=A0AAW1RXM0_9CHLO
MQTTTTLHPAPWKLSSGVCLGGINMAGTGGANIRQPPIATPDRAAGPASTTATPNAASTDSGASSTVAWEQLVEQSCASTPVPSPLPAAGDGWCRWPSRRGCGACAAADRLHAPSPLMGECFEADYVLHQCARLGRGASGAVYRCSVVGAPAGEQYAVKVIALRKYEDRALAGRERRALELLRGAARVVQLRRAYVAACRAHLVFELLGQGSTLRELLHQSAGAPPPALLRGIARELLLALSEVHARGLCHLDVKPANVWVAGSSAAPRVCLLDLAFAHEFALGGRAMMAVPSALCGSPAYMAPEVVAADAAHLRTHRFAPYDGRAADAWSAGVTLFEAAFPGAGPPFCPPAKALDPLAEIAALHAAWAAATPAHPVMQQLAAATPQERDFWQRLLSADPGVRLTVEAALAHPFLQGSC